MKINILSKSVYNRIAAGEVIDRPYSAVKELVENSIDAGATEIEIYIEQGGKQLIRVVDNGCGIERDDMRAAFLPHATSKIKSAEDLEKITTLGFRGEALASISVIAKVELISATDNNGGYKVTCVDGNVSVPEPAAIERGTDINVMNLFYNTPVRAKFLKPDKKEEADITSFVTRYILSNPNVSFRYYVDGKLTLQSTGEGIDDAMAQVYGTKTVSQCIKIDGQKFGIRIHGFIGNQNFSKPNKTYQSIFLNGRYIVNNTINIAITTAYATYLMKRQYPFYVLNVDVPSDMVDVNVHPNKADVRFVDNKIVFDAVHAVVSSVLDGTASAAQFVVDYVDKKWLPEVKSTNSEKTETPVAKPQQMGIRIEMSEPVKSVVEEKEKTEIKDPAESTQYFNYIPSSDPLILQVTNDCMPNRRVGKEPSPQEEELYAQIRYEQQMLEYESCKFRGALFNTYLMYEICDKVYMIDQHAAHERLIYDRLRKKLSERKQIDRQGLIMPYVLQINEQERRFLEDYKEVISNLGFEVSQFGISTYKVDSIPADLSDLNIQEFFDDLLSDLNGLKEIKIEEMLKDKIATTACKHAIKGGKALTEQEVKTLFEMLKGNMGLKCPHGRPICVVLDKKDIEKMFKRIV